jgi:hypothetical protein
MSDTPLIDAISFSLDGHEFCAASLARELERERAQLLVLATKWCPKPHHDWEKILQLAEKEDGWEKILHLAKKEDDEYEKVLWSLRSAASFARRNNASS